MFVSRERHTYKHKERKREPVKDLEDAYRQKGEG